MYSGLFGNVQSGFRTDVSPSCLCWRGFTLTVFFIFVVTRLVREKCHLSAEGRNSWRRQVRVTQGARHRTLSLQCTDLTVSWAESQCFCELKTPTGDTEEEGKRQENIYNCIVSLGGLVCVQAVNWLIMNWSSLIWGLQAILYILNLQGQEQPHQLTNSWGVTSYQLKDQEERKLLPNQNFLAEFIPSDVIIILVSN